MLAQSTKQKEITPPESKPIKNVIAAIRETIAEIQESARKLPKLGTFLNVAAQGEILIFVIRFPKHVWSLQDDGNGKKALTLDGIKVIDDGEEKT